MLYGCIGEHLPHSFSKEIHALIGGYDYELTELKPNELDSFLRNKNFCGINVTIPYKQSVIPYLNGISDRAKRIGAVNTVINRNGILFGENTDYIGMKQLAQQNKISFFKKKVLILGTGGTSKTASAVAEDGGAGEIIKVSRRESDQAIGYETARTLHRDAEVIINTTPCGMYPNINETPVDLSDFPALNGLLDAVYNPLRTELVLQARSRGIPAVGGLYMLVAQAVAASELFTGQRYPDDTVERVFRKTVQNKENIVLIGMPSCGKSTVGKALAKETARVLIDLDLVITEKTGRTPAELINQYGTDVFRKIEAETVAAVSTETGCVIATGGGAVLHDDNVKNLRKNGKLVFLDRSQDRLLPSDDRPLSSSKEKLESLYAERYPVYLNAADLCIDANGTVPQILTAIRKECFI